MAGLLGLIRSKWIAPHDPTTSFVGKTVLLTGATGGLGLEAAIKFISLGAATLIIGARNLSKAEKAKQAIEARTKRTGIVQIWELDMNSFSSVKAFAARVNREVERLDVASLNAGLAMRKYEKSPDGWEETLQVNALSAALLALLLLPKLRASGTDEEPAHLAVTSSMLHAMVEPAWVKVDGSILEHLNSENGFHMARQYNSSKLFIEYIVKEIAALVIEPSGRTKVIVTSLCPSFCRSDLGRHIDAWWEEVFKVFFYAFFGRSTENGSRSLVSATTQGVESHGKFWKDDRFDLAGPMREDKALREKVWKEIIGVLEAQEPGIKELVKL
ncbi:hypothetical protein MMC30_000731 [Trapelia coarctata]|nr:hypothetical protein [Trapelia coarctata]